MEEEHSYQREGRLEDKLLLPSISHSLTSLPSTPSFSIFTLPSVSLLPCLYLPPYLLLSPLPSSYLSSLPNTPPSPSSSSFLDYFLLVLHPLPSPLSLYTSSFFPLSPHFLHLLHPPLLFPPSVPSPQDCIPSPPLTPSSPSPSLPLPSLPTVLIYLPPFSSPFP